MPFLTNPERGKQLHHHQLIIRITRQFSVCLILGVFLPHLNCPAAEPPNVVILFTDDQGTHDAGCYGSDHLITPNIDRLAAEGTRFTQAYAHTACCPARAALLTGRHPQRGGIDNYNHHFLHGNGFHDLYEGTEPVAAEGE